MKIELKRVGLFSVIKTLFVLGGVAGFLIGIVEWVLLAFLASLGESLPMGGSGFEQQAISELLNAGVGALALILPLFGGFAGAIGGVLFGAILTGFYNVSSRLWGGLEVECSEVTVETSRPTPIVPASGRGGVATALPSVVVSTGIPPRPESPRDTEPRPPAMYE